MSAVKTGKRRSIFLLYMEHPPDPYSCRNPARLKGALPSGGLVLFLCTGNYYRSRFAEIYFNHLAQKRESAWRAESRAIALDRGSGNLGPISAHAVRELVRRNVPLPSDTRMPLQAVEDDLARADIVAALCEREHRPLVRLRFPAWEERVEYWDVEDVEREDVCAAAETMEKHIHTLIDRLNGRSS